MRCAAEYCTECDAFHVRIFEYGLIGAVNKRILKMLSLGFRYREIGQDPEVNLSRKTVEHRIERMSSQLYALSTNHLVTLALYLGIIEPGLDLPEISEPCPTDLKPSTTTLSINTRAASL